MRLLPKLGYFAALLFNTMFAVLSTVTLLGIVLITRPQQVMHNVPPSWWIPLTLVMVPAQLYCQYLTLSTVFGKEVPTPLAISKRMGKPPALFRPLIGFLWGVNFLIGVAIVVSLYKPVQGQNVGWVMMLLLSFIVFSLTSCANVYWMLFIRTLTSNEKTIMLAWHCRFLVDLVITVTAIIYYKIGF